MGGISLFDGASKYIQNKSDYLFYISSGLLCLLVIVFFLYTWVDRLRRDISEQYSNELFYVSLFVLFMLAIVSGIVSVFSSQDKSINSMTVIEKKK